MRQWDTFSRPAIDSSEVMDVKRYLSPAFWALGMLVLILDSKTALAGAVQGLELCIRTLVPSLFPFFVLSGMLTSALSGGGLLLTGIFGGYPVGAANVARAYRSGQLSRAEAERLVVLCNCAGPSFLFGVVGQMLDSICAAFALWGVYLVSVLALWLVLPKSAQPHSPAGRPIRLSQALRDATHAMAGVCGWVILFRVLLSILDRWLLWLLPEWIRICVYGILELSNGCMVLDVLEPSLRFVFAAWMVGFGGLCVLLQTASVTEGISLRLYFPGKLFQGGICAVLAAAISGPRSPYLFLAGILAAGIGAVILRKSEKRCGNPCPVGV